MAEHVEVFISATTTDLGSYRGEVKNGLLTLGIFPIEQSNFALAHGPLTKVLHDLIGRCDAVIHLAGLHYGAEPPQRPPGESRRSYTQIEYDVARKLDKPIYLFVAAENYEADEADKLSTQSEEEEKLQLAHWHAIKNCGDNYVSFGNHEVIRTKVRELRFPAPSAGASRRVINLPDNSLGPLFKGRDTALAELRERLRIGPCQTIHGLGGVGKTRLAIEYAWRYAGDYTALLFAGAVDLRTNLAKFCDPLVLGLPEEGRPEEKLAAVFHWLYQHPGWLLILDNADTPEAAAEVEKALPQLQGGRVLITSRLADWGPAIQTAEPLDVLAEEDAAAFLLERTESRRKKMLTDSEDAATVARYLGGLALALEQGGAYVAKMHVSFLEYLRRWELLLAWHDERLMRYPKSVATTWQTTIEELSQSERKLLNILAWLAPEPIPLSLFERHIVDGADPRDTLAGLASWSLARWIADGEGFTVHRLVQEVTRQRLPDNEKDNTLNAALDLLNARLPSPGWDEKGWQLWERLAPHCRTLLNHLSGHVLEPKAVGMMNRYGFWLHYRAQYQDAEPLLRRALAIDEEHLPPNHLYVAGDLNNLAELLRATSRLEEAEPHYRRALAIRENELGLNHLDVAQSLNNLAVLLNQTNRSVEAESYYRRALAIRENELGPRHQDVAQSLNHLAVLLRQTHRSAEAEPLLRRALAIDEECLGLDHPKVATRLNNLAVLLRQTNRYAEAEPLLRRALAITEKSFDPDHPKVATRLNSLAMLFRHTNRLAEAESLYRRTLTITEKSFGPDHPKVAIRLKNLASLLSDANRLTEAEPLRRRYLRILAEIAARKRSAIEGEPQASP